MEESNIKCPVCGSSVLSNWNCCHNCGFEIHILPDNVNPIIHNYEESRVKNAKRFYEISNQKLVEKDAEILKKEEECKNLLEKQSSDADTIKSLSDSKTELMQQIQNMNIRVEHLISEVDILHKELEKQQNECRKEPSVSTTSALAYLIQFDDDEAQNIYSLVEGSNSFGSAPSKPGHTQVILGDLESEHFTINVTMSNGKIKIPLDVIPNQGGITIDNPSATPITKGTLALDMNSDIYAGGLRFRLLPNKR